MPGRDELLDLPQHPLAALQLDGLRARLLQEPDRRVQRRLRRGLVGAERQVGDDQRPLLPRTTAAVSGSRSSTVTGMVRVVAEDHHRRGVADQQHRDPGVVEDSRGERVVGGEHGPLLAALLGGGEVAHGDPPPAVPSVQWFRLPGAVLPGAVLPCAALSVVRCPVAAVLGTLCCAVIWILHVSWRPCGVPGHLDDDMRRFRGTGPESPYAKCDTMPYRIDSNHRSASRRTAWIRRQSSGADGSSSAS